MPKDYCDCLDCSDTPIEQRPRPIDENCNGVHTSLQDIFNCADCARILED